MVGVVVLDDKGIPICCGMWPGNTADVTTLKEVVKRFQTCFGILDVCVVADRAAIVDSLRQKLREGDKSLVGNKGSRKYLKTGAGSGCLYHSSLGEL